jgi:hypothetical protein
MSSYLAIQAVSEALRHVLWEQYVADDVIRPIVGSEAAISFKNPTETARDSGNRLSLWLYHVTENEFVKNQPPLRANGPESIQVPPMAINLFYLVTPFAQTGEADHMLLGKTIQTMYDNAIVLLRDPVSQIAEELRIVFCRLSLEELTRVWEALREPYRLSICYEVRVTRVDSQRVQQHARVVERGVARAPLPMSPAGLQ